jgi:hypothetical protein
VRRSRLQGRSLAASAALDERCERCLDVALVVGIVPDELLTYRLRRIGQKFAPSFAHKMLPSALIWIKQRPPCGSSATMTSAAVIVEMIVKKRTHALVI